MLTLGEVLGILKYPRRIPRTQQALWAQLCEFQLRLNNPFDVCQLQGIALVGVRSLQLLAGRQVFEICSSRILRMRHYTSAHNISSVEVRAVVEDRRVWGPLRPDRVFGGTVSGGSTCDTYTY